ncbi:hydrogenase small subunit [Geomonas azotofigens]|uniref:hydrogenase small subunit n=1 Tax=Geomonas azotofigens TaxID=2843196 RepID=UPI001C11D282|nr:hydrogenase small subunit [Geomonas azotofigens]MBU5614773.1 hydrogenase small subunit [Geomonas azotofigens]
MNDPPDGGWSRGETFLQFVRRRGVSRREFLSFCGRMAACFGAAAALPPGSRALAREMAGKLSAARRPSVIYLQLQECTGCLESLLRSGSSPIDRLVLEQISLDYNELLMAPSGDAAEAVLREASDRPHLLLVNGSVPLGQNGAFCTIGGDSAENLLRRAARKANAIMAVGACAEYGCVQAASPNLTGAVGVAQVITDRPVVNISGCPPIAETITATLTYYLAYGHTPPLDGMGRPLFAYGQRIHDKCPRRASFDAGQFAERFDDENARRGYCLYRLGCKGPATFAPCATVEWNLGQSFPIKAGHPCLGCTERDFYDRMTPFYRRLPGFVVPGLGVEATANTVGVAAVAASVGGVLVHSAATVIAKKRAKKAQPETLPLAVLGDTEKPARDEDQKT